MELAEGRQYTFAELGLKDELVRRLSEAGIDAPAPVQAQAIPAMLGGRDGVLVSPTGTGKTLAYLLPVLQRLDASLRRCQALVLAPTQELAMQIAREAERYGAPLGIRTAALIGGASLKRQLERMKEKPQLVVGTPGRVREVAELGKLQLPFVRHVVADETDRLFALGGREDTEWLLGRCAKDRQIVFVSATRSEAMREAEARWLREPWETREAAQADGAGSALPDTIRHWYFVCGRREKIGLVRRLLFHLGLRPALLFLNDMDQIGVLSAKLKYEGFAVDALYGDTAGEERKEALRRFLAGRTDLLIATDVAARGLDVPGLPLVIQFDPALDAEHYVHRAGRTGRMGREGLSVMLVTPAEQFMAEKLARRLGITIEQKTLYEGRVMSPDEAAALRRRRSAEDRGEVRGAAERKGRGASARSPIGSAERKSLAAPPGAPAAGGAKPKAARAKADRLLDRKNKGAPKWLKEKWAKESAPDA